MSSSTGLIPLCDPTSLAKLQILLVPVHHSSSSSPVLSEPIYDCWTTLIRRHQTLRGDELRRPDSSSSSGHSRPHAPSLRFFPSSTGTSISKAPSNHHVHLAFPFHPPARHLYPLSLLRIVDFPLVVIGIAVDPGEGGGPVKGYTVDEEDLENSGDIGQASTPGPHAASYPVRHPSSPSDSFNSAVDGLFPPTSPFPLIRRLLVVPPHLPRHTTPKPSLVKNGLDGGAPGLPGGGQTAKGKERQGEVVYAPSEGIEGWLGRMLGDVVGQVLGELGELATALETPAGLKTLSSTLLPSITSTLPTTGPNYSIPRSSTPTSDMPERPRSGTPLSSLPHSQSMDSLGGMGMSLKRSLTPGGRPTSVGPPSLPPIQTTSITPSALPGPSSSSSSSNPFRRSTALTSPFTRSTSATSISSHSHNSAPSVPTIQALATRYTSAPLSGVGGGRLLKLLGDMYLLAGMYGHAIKCFDDGADRCRAVGDVLWEAATREGMAVAGIGEAWEGRDGSNMTKPFPACPIPNEILSHYFSALACLSRAPVPYPPTILSPSPHAAFGSLSIPSPTSPTSSAIGTGEGLLAFLYSGLCLRISHFHLLIWAAGGWGSTALSAIISHSLPRTFPLPLSPDEFPHTTARRGRQRTLAMLSSRSRVARYSVFGPAEQALAPYHRAMTKIEQLNLHVEVTWLARWLDLPRKEAYCSREVVKRVGILVVEGREEIRRLSSGKSSRGTRSKEASAAEAAVGLGLGMAVAAPQAVAVRRKESTEGNQGVMALFERACSLMGIDLLPSASPTEQARNGPRFGWPELQIEMMKEGIAVAEALPDHPSVIRLCTSALRSLHMYLNDPTQAHLAKMYPASLATVRRRGLDYTGVGWWLPGRTVLSMEIGRIPIPRARAEIISRNGSKDPFLYNPRLKAAEAAKTLLVANEQVDVFVTVQNPFAFDLEIQNLSLLTSGVPFTTSPLLLSLPPISIQTVRLTGITTDPGTVRFRGVSIRLSDGSSTEVLLPVFDEKDVQRRDKRRSRLSSELGKIKRLGLEARFPVSAEPPEAELESWIECSIVEEQPLLWIKNTSLTHGTVMLYNGESSMIRITLENSSAVPVDFIKLSFGDSTARSAQLAISNGELSPEEAYELERDNMNRPVFAWDNDGQTRIPPGGRTTLWIQCLGKVGCVDGSIRIDYGLVERGSDIPSLFHTRQITFPVLFTVYHTLETYALDLIRLLSSASRPPLNGYHLSLPNGQTSRPTTPRSGSFEQSAEDRSKRQLAKENDEAHCLLALCIRNVYGVPFEVTLVRAEGSDDEVSASRLVPPGATERIILPIPRRSLPRSILSQPIPSLSERQYVVDKSKKSTTELDTQRELFWYRDDLLRSLSATWIEPGSRRSGTLSLRDQPLSPNLLDVLRLDDLEITLLLAPRASKVLRVTDFADITLRVINRLQRPIRPYVRIEPLQWSSTDSSWASAAATIPRRPTSAQPPPPTSRNLAFDGILSRTLPLLQPGEQAEHTVGVIFLASGDFVLRAAVEEVQLSMSTGKEPKIRFSSLLHVEVAN